MLSLVLWFSQGMALLQLAGIRIIVMLLSNYPHLKCVTDALNCLQVSVETVNSLLCIPQ